MVHGIEPHIGLHADSTDPAWDSLSLSLFPFPTCVFSLSLLMNKWTLKRKKERFSGLGCYLKSQIRWLLISLPSIKFQRPVMLSLIWTQIHPHPTDLKEALLTSNISSACWVTWTWLTLSSTSLLEMTGELSQPQIWGSSQPQVKCLLGKFLSFSEFFHMSNVDDTSD